MCHDSLRVATLVQKSFVVTRVTESFTSWYPPSAFLVNDSLKTTLFPIWETFYPACRYDELSRLPHWAFLNPAAHSRSTFDGGSGCEKREYSCQTMRPSSTLCCKVCMTLNTGKSLSSQSHVIILLWNWHMSPSGNLIAYLIACLFNNGFPIVFIASTTCAFFSLREEDRNIRDSIDDDDSLLYKVPLD